MATLYAQPSKEWVVPAKPKPGRKPKRDEPVVDEEVGVSSLSDLSLYTFAHCAMRHAAGRCDVGHMGRPAHLA